MGNKQREKDWGTIILVIAMTALFLTLFVRFDFPEPDYSTPKQIANRINHQYLQVKKDIVDSYNNIVKQALDNKQQVSVADFISKSEQLVDYNKKVFDTITNSVESNKNAKYSIYKDYKSFHVKKLLDFQQKLVEKIQKINNSPQISLNNVKIGLNPNENNILKRDVQTQIVDRLREGNRKQGEFIIVIIRFVLGFIALVAIMLKK